MTHCGGLLFVLGIGLSAFSGGFSRILVSTASAFLFLGVMATPTCFDALPLPVFYSPSVVGWRRSRSHTARARFSLERIFDEVVSWIIGLSTFRVGRGRIVPFLPEQNSFLPSDAQFESRRLVVDRNSSNGHGQATLVPVEALAALLKTSNLYSAVAGITERPYNP